MPITEKEKDPLAKKPAGGGSAVANYALSASIVLIGIMQMVIADDFLTGIRSYFWPQAQGHVVNSDLTSFTNTGSGEVVYEFDLDGVTISQTTRVFKEWSWGRRVKYDSWAKQYAKGEKVTIFHNGSGTYSLGHWPMGADSIGLIGMLNATLGLGFLLRNFIKRKMARRTEQS